MSQGSQGEQVLAEAYRGKAKDAEKRKQSLINEATELMKISGSIVEKVK